MSIKPENTRRKQMFKNKLFQKIIAPLIIIALVMFILANVPSSVGLFKAAFKVLAPVLLGVSFAFILNIPMRKLEHLWERIFEKRKDRKINQKIRRPICIVLCIILMIGVIVGLVFLLVPQITKTVNGLIQKLPEYMNDIMMLWEKIVVWLEEYSIELPHWNIDTAKIIAKITELVSSGDNDIIGSSISFAGSLFSLVFDVFFAFVISIYILSHKERIMHGIKRVNEAFFSKRTSDSVYDILLLINRTFANFLSGQLIEAIILGGLCFVGMLIFRMPYALLISAIMTVTALVPIFGAFIGAGIGAFFILLENPIQSLWFIVFIIVLQQLEGNIIYPKVVGKKMGLPALWVLVAVTVGASFGIIGMLVSVPIFSVVYTLIDHIVLYHEKKRAGELDEDVTPFSSLFDEDAEDSDSGKNDVKLFKTVRRKIRKMAIARAKRAQEKAKQKESESANENAEGKVGEDASVK